MCVTVPQRSCFGLPVEVKILFWQIMPTQFRAIGEVILPPQGALAVGATHFGFTRGGPTIGAQVDFENADQ